MRGSAYGIKRHARFRLLYPRALWLLLLFLFDIISARLRLISRVYLVVYNIGGPTLPYIIDTIFVLRYHEVFSLHND